MKSMQVAFPAAVVTLVTALLAIGWFGYRYPMSVLGYPLVLGLIVIVTGVSVCAMELAKPRDASAKKSTKKDVGTHSAAHSAAHHATHCSEDEAASLRGASVWVHLACPVLLMGLGWVLGFIPAIVVFVLGYLRIAGWSWRASVLYGFAAGFVVWVLFDLMFFQPLPFWPIFMR
ncbi:tripartite tricarboxylate transporter TctB family protein [Paraburkholderia sp. ZP32-5]|uniref:tripartite tricarboxylate transporter TctB family protein n=1 Tax=Paraburkholderia sp. ZP32-5 TaxID=2883245 RepID=UPI001F36869B|nr:tripartite tricarboxylate transporter TctB family protein [Paraburkholderia sp. ZP32-5]